MMRTIEKTVFLRSLNYLRVSHQYALRYNWIYPFLLGTIMTTVVLRLASASSIFEKGGFLTSFMPVLSTLTPFYIAALAAVSTFSGNKSVDEPFGMSKPVLLDIIGDGGDWEHIDVTPRHFLSLLFGYCTATSILLLAISIFAPFIYMGIVALLYEWSQVILGAIFALFMFLLSQLILGTLLGVYFLADKIHRK